MGIFQPAMLVYQRVFVYYIILYYCKPILQNTENLMDTSRVLYWQIFLTWAKNVTSSQHHHYINNSTKTRRDLPFGPPKQDKILALHRGVGNHTNGCPAGSDRFTIVSKRVYFTPFRGQNQPTYSGYNPFTIYLLTSMDALVVNGLFYPYK